MAPHHTSQRHTAEEIRTRLAAELPDWEYDGRWIQRCYRTDGWPVTLMLVNQIGFVAEAADHHPELIVRWAEVWVKLQTHSADGITDQDFDLARKLDEVALWRPGPESSLAGAPGGFVRGGPRQGEG